LFGNGHSRQCQAGDEVLRQEAEAIAGIADVARPGGIEEVSAEIAAAVGEDQAKELTSDGNFYRTLWHEVGHYLGVDQTKDGRDLAQRHHACRLAHLAFDRYQHFAFDRLRIGAGRVRVRLGVWCEA